MIQLMSFSEWEAVQDPEKVFEWGQTTKQTDSLMEHIKKRFKDTPHSTRWHFYSNYVHNQVGEEYEKINSSKPKDSE